ncbi:MAG: hypothetical protein CSA62_15000 [Planctomycetota bacterium]|nr:MAG: hypothetical protein CSA62_15000 [Planctomycetota bacterium]
MRKMILALLFGASLLSLSSCGTARRAAKDASVVALSPAIILYGAGTDGVVDAQNMQAGLEWGDATQAVFLPFTFLWNGVVHSAKVLVHGVDFLLFPAYGVAELHPAGPEIEPLQIYTGTFFDEDSEEKSVGPDETGAAN